MPAWSVCVFLVRWKAMMATITLSRFLVMSWNDKRCGAATRLRLRRRHRSAGQDALLIGLKIPARDYKSIRNVQHGYCDVATLIRNCCQNEIVDYATVTLGDELLFRERELLTMTSLQILILMDPQRGLGTLKMFYGAHVDKFEYLRESSVIEVEVLKILRKEEQFWGNGHIEHRLYFYYVVLPL